MRIVDCYDYDVKLRVMPIHMHPSVLLMSQCCCALLRYDVNTRAIPMRIVDSYDYDVNLQVIPPHIEFLSFMHVSVLPMHELTAAYRSAIGSRQ